MAKKLTEEEIARRNQEKANRDLARLAAQEKRRADRDAKADERRRRKEERDQQKAFDAEVRRQEALRRQREKNQRQIAAAVQRDRDRELRAIEKQRVAERRLADERERAFLKLTRLQTAMAARAARIRPTRFTGSGISGRGFRPSAGAQLADLMASPASPLPALPLFPDAATPEFTVPKSRQSILNRLSGGRLFQPRAPVAGSGASFGSRIDGGIDKLIGLRDSVEEAQRGGLLDKLSMALKGRPGAVALAGAASAATATVGALGGVIGVLREAFFKTWEYVDTKVLPTTSMLNQALGASTANMGRLRSAAMGIGLQFERLGLGFEQGAQAVKDIGVGLKTANISREGITTLVKVSEYAGVGAEQAGKLARSFQATGGSIGDVERAMLDASVAADAFNVPVNLIRKEFGDNIDILQRWGTANYMQFNRAIARAQAYGLSIRDVESSFGQALDTFETSSDVASKINSVFNTGLDSIRLMEANDIDRMTMVQDAIRNTGFVWDTASKYEKNLLQATLNLKDADEGARLFGSQGARIAASARIAQQDRITKGMNDWRNALSSLGRQLTSIEQLTRNFFMAIGNVVAKLLGFKSGIDATKTGVKAFEGFMDQLTGRINDFADALPDRSGKGNGFLDWLNTITQSLKDMKNGAFDALDAFEDISTLGEGESSSMAKELSNLLANPIGNADALSRMQTRIFTPSILNPAEGRETVRKAARRVGRTEEEVMSILTEGVRNQVDPVRPYRIPEPMDFSGTPVIIQFNVDGNEVARQLVPATQRQTVRRAITGRP
jgi:hypothetical protein